MTLCKTNTKNVMESIELSVDLEGNTIKRLNKAHVSDSHLTCFSELLRNK